MSEQKTLFANPDKDKKVSKWNDMDKSIAAARAQFFAALEDGAVCPVCDRFGKVYTRKLNSGMVATLCWIVQVYLDNKEEEWIDVAQDAPRFVLKNREFGRLVHWGLIIPKRNMEDKTKRDSGLWKPTVLGIKFATRKDAVPKEVKIWKNELIWTSDERIDVLTALNNKFDYEELMGRKE